MLAPITGVLVFATAFVAGGALGFVARSRLAAPVLLLGAVVGDLIAIATGRFVFLGELWFAPPVVFSAGGILGWLVALAVTVRR